MALFQLQVPVEAIYTPSSPQKCMYWIIFWFQPPTFPCRKTLLKHCPCHALHSTKPNDLWVSNSDLMLLNCQSNMQAVTKIRHLLETGNTPGEVQSYLLTLHKHWCTQKIIRKVERLFPDSLQVFLKSFYMTSGSPCSRETHRTEAPPSQPQAGKFNTGTPLQSKNIVPLFSQEIQVLIFSYISRTFFFFFISFSEEQEKW